MKRLLPVLMGFVFLLLSSTEGWSLPPCQGSPASSYSTTNIWTDCFGTIIFSHGYKYVGEWKNGNYYGQGTLTYPSGSKYVGEYRDNKKHGQGTETSADGRVKEGIWKGSVFQYAKKPSPTVTAQKTSTYNPEHLKRLKETNTCPNCDLQGAPLWGADLIGADLIGANLQEANLIRADLRSAKFKGANLQGALLNFAKLDPEGIKIAKASGAINVPEPVVVFKKPKFFNQPHTRRMDRDLLLREEPYLDLPQNRHVLENDRTVITKGENGQWAEYRHYDALTGKAGSVIGYHWVGKFPPTVTAKKTTTYNPEHLKRLKRTRKCPKCNLQGAYLFGANLYGANLQGAKLQGANLMGANLKGANFKGANLRGAKFQRANLMGAKLDPEGIKIAKASGAFYVPEPVVVVKTPKFIDQPQTRRMDRDLPLREAPYLDSIKNKYVFYDQVYLITRDANQEWEEFRHYDVLTGKYGRVIGYRWLGKRIPPTVTAKKKWTAYYLKRLKETNNCSYCGLRGANLAGANHAYANLQGAKLQGANLEGANLKGANLKSANLEKANLRDANLQGADLFQVDLQGTNLRNANLQGAMLQEANLQGANFKGALLRNAKLRGANLQGAKLDAEGIKIAKATGAFNIPEPVIVAKKTPKKKPKPPVVTKVTPKKAEPPAQSGSGSGFFVSRFGHVITNEHVVRGCKSVTVGDNAKKQSPVTVEETDRRNDLALLKLSTLTMASAETKSLIRKLGVKVVPLASDGLLRLDDIELGEKVMVAGYPYGDIFSDTIKVTFGNVSATRGMGDDSGQFQLDAAVQPGNSGGPIYDEKGNIVGVVVAQLNKLKMAKAIGSMPENVNFGIKTSTVRQFLTSSGLPTKWSRRSNSMSGKELAKIAQKQTLMVMCHQ